MNGYLLVVALGPVQDFIRAARRTRDLWFGSYMLSELSKAAAREIDVNGGKLIFPMATGRELEPDSKLLVANQVLAELPPSASPPPEELVEKVKGAVQGTISQERFFIAQGRSFEKRFGQAK